MYRQESPNYSYDELWILRISQTNPMSMYTNRIAPLRNIEQTSEETSLEKNSLPSLSKLQERLFIYYVLIERSIDEHHR